MATQATGRHGLGIQRSRRSTRGAAGCRGRGVCGHGIPDVQVRKGLPVNPHRHVNALRPIAGAGPAPILGVAAQTAASAPRSSGRRQRLPRPGDAPHNLHICARVSARGWRTSGRKTRKTCARPGRELRRHRARQTHVLRAQTLPSGVSTEARFPRASETGGSTALDTLPASRTGGRQRPLRQAQGVPPWRPWDCCLTIEEERRGRCEALADRRVCSRPVGPTSAPCCRGSFSRGSSHAFAEVRGLGSETCR
jgi:hypothetical protein